MEQNQIFLPVEYSLLKTFTHGCRDYGIMENQILPNMLLQQRVVAFAWI